MNSLYRLMPSGEIVKCNCRVVMYKFCGNYCFFGEGWPLLDVLHLLSDKRSEYLCAFVPEDEAFALFANILSEATRPLYQGSFYRYIKKMDKPPFKLRFLFFALGIVLFLCACVTTVVIPYDLSPAELIQRGQEAADRNRFNVALQYYEALRDRNRDSLDLVITAEYEIAFIHYKQRDFPQARAGFNAILEHYESPDAELLPQQFRRLAEVVLARIDESEQRAARVPAWFPFRF